MAIQFSDTYLIARCEVAECDYRTRPKVTRAVTAYLRARGLKRRYCFPKTDAGLKLTAAKISDLNAALVDFPDLDKITIEQSEGFSM